MKFDDNNVPLLCNFDEQFSGDVGIVNKLWSGEWAIEDVKLCQELLSTELETDLLLNLINRANEQGVHIDRFLHLAINSFLTFCNQNWNPHPDKVNLEDFLGMKWPKNVDAILKLQCDSEPVFVNIVYPELLYLSLQVFDTLCIVEGNLLYMWWSFRAKVTHQRVLEDTSGTIYSELELLTAKLSNQLQALTDKRRLQILLCLEIAQAFLIYARINKVEEFLLKARDFSGLKLELTGILGKRTKFQEKSLPQLALSSELETSVDRPSAEDSHGSSELPPQIELQDDVRLDRIQYNKQISQVDLPSLEQTLCLLTVQHIQKSRPKDDLMVEELQPYIEAILTQKKGPWPTRVAALLNRCKLEANHKRTVERAMMQCEAIVNDKTGISPTSRLSYLWASGLQPSWTWRQQLADLYVSLGLVKAALEEYQKLQLWEDIIVCYTILQLRHKAAEVIQQQINIEPTVKLYCLLGDATDDVSCYEKAWEFSNHKSSRAQRHWGNFLFNHKKYEECIPHFEKSVEINSIQESVWLRLGYAALMVEQWETSAKAYRRYTYLQPNTFEAWNNLAKIYVKQGDKNRAYKALMEALKFNYDNWKLWENVIIVSVDTGHFEDVIRGVHRMLDLRHKYEDLEVLTLLVRAVVQDYKDIDGNSAARLQRRMLELFGRITSLQQNVPEIWQLYSDLSPTYLLKAQRILKAYRGFTAIACRRFSLVCDYIWYMALHEMALWEYKSGTWSNNPETCKKVIDLAQTLLQYSMEAREHAEDKEKLQCDQQLSSARLTGQAVMRAAEKQNWPEMGTDLVKLKDLFESVTEYMKSIMYTSVLLSKQLKQLYVSFNSSKVTVIF